MPNFLKIENPGVAAAEAFTLLGASTKRGGSNTQVIGSFGTGNKQAIGVLLRNDLNPVVFAGNLRLEFSVRLQSVNDGIQDTNFNRVQVKFSGKDADGINRSSTEDLGFVLEHGSADWHHSSLALREFISNAIDRAITQGEFDFIQKYALENFGSTETLSSYEREALENALLEYRKTSSDYNNVTIEIVNENQVRAKTGTTRIFVPMNDEIFNFYNNLGKWFLHFSEPELLKETILPKKNRNISQDGTAVIYRRGVRVREISCREKSLFDYNLENLKLDESRQVDDWLVRHEAAKALSSCGKTNVISQLFLSFTQPETFWEQRFEGYGLDSIFIDNDPIWHEAFDSVFSPNTIFATKDGGDLAKRKGYKVVEVPNEIYNSVAKRGLRTPVTVLSDDEREGLEILPATLDAITAVDFIWSLIEKYKITNGKQKPPVKTFRKLVDAGSKLWGYYKDGSVYINQDIAGNSGLPWSDLNHQLLAVSLEEVIHYVTQAADFSRDFQDSIVNLVIYLAKEKTNA